MQVQQNQLLFAADVSVSYYAQLLSRLRSLQQMITSFCIQRLGVCSGASAMMSNLGLALPLSGDLAAVDYSTVMSLKLQLKLEVFGGKEEEWPMFALAFESSLTNAGVPLCMLDWAEKYDAGLRFSNHQVYDLLDHKIFAALSTSVSRKALDVGYILLRDDLARHGRKTFRAMKERYTPGGIGPQMGLQDELTTIEMGGQSVAEYFGRGRYLRSRLQQTGVTMVDSILLSLLLRGLPDTEGYRIVTATIRSMPAVDLDEAERRLQAQFDAERAAGAAGIRALAAAARAQPGSQTGAGAPARRYGACFWCSKEGHHMSDCKAKQRGSEPAAGSVAEQRGWKQKPAKEERKDSGTRVCSVRAKQPEEATGSGDTSTVRALRAGTRGLRPGDFRIIVDCGAERHVLDTDLLAEQMGGSADSIMSAWRPERIQIDGVTTSSEPTFSAGVASFHLGVRAGGEYEQLELQQALVVPGSGHLLLSAGLLVEHGGSVVLNPEDPHLILPGEPRVKVPLEPFERVWLVQVRGEPAAAAGKNGGGAKALAVSLNTWHERFGHLNLSDLRLLAAQEGSGIKLPAGELLPCEVCHLGKAAHQPHPPRASQGVLSEGHTWHADTIGPYEGAAGSRGKCKYLRLFVDEATRYHVGYFRSSKGEFIADVEQLRAEVLAPMGRHMGGLHLDYESVFTAEDLLQHGRDAGFTVSNSPPYNHESNGLAERAARTVNSKACCSMLQSKLPAHLWECAVGHAVYLINRSPHSALGGKTPYEAWFGKVPNVAHVRVFGSYAYVCAEGEAAGGKLTARSWRGRFVGYPESVEGAYCVYNESTRRVVVTRNVTFIEGEPAIAAADDAAAVAAADAAAQGEPGEAAAAAAAAPAGGQGTAAAAAADAATVGEPAAAAAVADGEGAAAAAAADADAAKPADGEGVLAGSHTRSGRGYSPVYALAAMAGVMPTDPLSYRQATAGPDASKWRAACEKEYSDLEGRGTWELVPCSEVPEGAKVLGSTWVFKTKYGENGVEERKKARFVVRGDQQRPGVDYGDVFAPTASASSLRIVVALAVQHGLELRVGDFDNAFAQADVDQLVFVNQPEGFVRRGVNGEPLVLRLRKSLYGLCQSPKLWHETLIEVLRKHGFQQAAADQCVLFNSGTGVIIAMHVDDILFAGRGAALRSAIDIIGGALAIKDLGQARRYLGINFRRGDDGSVTMSQRDFIDSLLDKFSMLDAHEVETPATAQVSFSADGESPLLEERAVTMYQSLVGALQWLATCTRPDISFAVSQLQRHMAAPRQCHLEGAKRVLRYLKGNKGGITYRRQQGKELQLFGYADASFASSPDRRSHTGYVFMLCGAAVAWRSAKQPCVTLSTAEAEYVALCAACKEVPVMVQLLEFLGVRQGPVRLLEDNTAAVRLAVDAGACQRTKHIDVKFHFVREMVAKKAVEVEAVRTEAQHADVLTKALPRVQHAFHSAALLGSS